MLYNLFRYRRIGNYYYYVILFVRFNMITLYSFDKIIIMEKKKMFKIYYFKRTAGALKMHYYYYKYM